MTPPPESTPPATVAPVAWWVRNVDRRDDQGIVTFLVTEADSLRRDGYAVLPLYAADVPALMARIERAEAERDEAQRDLADLAGGRVTIHDLTIRNGKIDATFGGEVVQEIGLLFVDAYRKSGAVNYLEMTFHGKTEAGELERFTMTIQRVNGKTPHECRVEAERERDAARAALGREGA